MWSSRRANEAVKEVLARHLRRGVRSTHDALAYLRRHEVSAAVAARLVAELQACGALDDVACAHLWADHWARKGYAWSAICLKLAAKGLDERAIAQGAAQVTAPSDDEARAHDVVARRSSGRRLPARPDDRRAGGDRNERVRLARRLAFRGYDADLIERVLTKALGSSPVTRSTSIRE